MISLNQERIRLLFFDKSSNVIRRSNVQSLKLSLNPQYRISSSGKFFCSYKSFCVLSENTFFFTSDNKITRGFLNDWKDFYDRYSKSGQFMEQLEFLEGLKNNSFQQQFDLDAIKEENKDFDVQIKTWFEEGVQ